MKLGKNYVYAYTIDAEGQVKGLTVNMYRELTELPAFGLTLKGTTAKEITVDITEPELLEGVSYALHWGPADEIGELTDEELFARDLAQWKTELEQWASFNWTLLNVQSAWAAMSGDYTDLNIINDFQQYQSYSYPNYYTSFNEETSYVVYVYAFRLTEDNTNAELISKVSKISAETKKIEKVAFNAEFGIDRVEYSNMIMTDMAYFYANPSNKKQPYIFVSCPAEQTEAIIAESLGQESYDGTTPFDTARVLDMVIESLQFNFMNPLPINTDYTTLPESAMYCQGLYDYFGAAYYHFAVATTEDGVYCSNFVVEKRTYTEEDLTTYTEDKMNLVVTGEAPNYVATVTPSGYCIDEEMGYIFETVTHTDLENYIVDNNIDPYAYGDDMVRAYVSTNVENYIKQAAASGQDKQMAISFYLMEGEWQSPKSKNITVEDDYVYVIAYTLYHRSGVVNGLEYKLLEPPMPEGEKVILTETDNVQLDFNNRTYPYTFNFTWNGGQIRFKNQDGEWNDELGKDTSTGHIILNQIYSSSGDNYQVDLDGELTYLGEEYQTMATRATLIITDNNNDTYTVIAKVIWDDNTCIEYTWTGAIDSELINGISE